MVVAVCAEGLAALRHGRALRAGVACLVEEEALLAPAALRCVGARASERLNNAARDWCAGLTCAALEARLALAALGVSLRGAVDTQVMANRVGAVWHFGALGACRGPITKVTNVALVADGIASTRAFHIG